jgi:small subunit ribosomal protein S1
MNEEKQRISLGIKQMTEDPWIHAIPEKYIPGQIIKGKIAKLTNFGAFVELEPDLEGLLHISELADHKVDKPQDVVKPGDEVEVKILKVDADARKIGLSLRRVQWAAEEKKEAGSGRGRGKARAKEAAPDAGAGQPSQIQDKSTAAEPQEPAQSVQQQESVAAPTANVVESGGVVEAPPAQADAQQQETEKTGQ